MKIGDVWCVDIVLSTGDGKAKEIDSRATVYVKQDGAIYNPKGKITKEVLSIIEKKHTNFPFTMRALGTEAHAKFAIRELKEHDMLIEYPVLHEKPGAIVAHVKLTALIRANATDRITSLPLDTTRIKSDKKVTHAAALKALSTEVAAVKRKDKKKGAAGGGSGGATPVKDGKATTSS